MSTEGQNISTGENDMRSEDLAALFNRTHVLNKSPEETTRALEECERDLKILSQAIKENMTPLDEILNLIEASKSAPKP